MVNKNIVENALAAIQVNIRELRNAVDIDWNTYTSDIRSRRFIERTLIHRRTIIELLLYWV